MTTHWRGRIGVPRLGSCIGPVAAAALLAVLLTVCDDLTSRPAPTPDAWRTPVVTTAPTATVSPETQKAIDFREQYGLRADVGWVQQVARDPAALVPEDFGIPLMPAEVANLLSRHWSNTLIQQLHDYGHLFPDDFAMAYVNQRGSGAIVKFKANLDRHRLALAQLPLDGPVIVEKADWSLKELEENLAAVKAQRRWIESTGATWVDPVVYELENRVVVRYEGPRGLERLIEEHFGNPGWLVARWEGPG